MTGGRDLALLGPELLHAEDLAPGDHLALGSTRVTEAEIIAFAERYDPLPIHVDPEAAARGHFGSVIASATHTLALYSSLASRTFIPRLALLAGKGIDRLRLPHPVRPLDELTAHIRVEAVRIREECADAEVRCRATMSRGDGSIVLSFEALQIVRMRGSGT